MDLGTLIISLVCIFAFVVPFVIFNRRNKAASTALVKQLKEYAASHQFEVSEYEKEGELVLGIDHDKKVAFFLDGTNKETARPVHVNLADFSMCRVNQVNDGVKDDAIIKKIALDFIPKSRKEENVSFVLYEESDERRLNNEVQLSRGWVDVFNRRIK